jgi:hypothetical protein
VSRGFVSTTLGYNVYACVLCVFDGVYVYSLAHASRAGALLQQHAGIALTDAMQLALVTRLQCAAMHVSMCACVL